MNWVSQFNKSSLDMMWNYPFQGFFSKEKCSFNTSFIMLICSFQILDKTLSYNIIICTYTVCNLFVHPLNLHVFLFTFWEWIIFEIQLFEDQSVFYSSLFQLLEFCHLLPTHPCINHRVREGKQAISYQFFFSNWEGLEASGKIFNLYLGKLKFIFFFFYKPFSQ